MSEYAHALDRMERGEPAPDVPASDGAADQPSKEQQKPKTPKRTQCYIVAAVVTVLIILSGGGIGMYMCKNNEKTDVPPTGDQPKHTDPPSGDSIEPGETGTISFAVIAKLESALAGYNAEEISSALASAEAITN